jgi:TetR/AcrR family transcriptional regulator, repressor of fatR-cypB operon
MKQANVRSTEGELVPPEKRAIAGGRSNPSLQLAGSGGARDRILAAALDLFEEQGFDATAVPEVAQRAAVATGSIYRYFKSKDDLVNALYREWKLRYYEIVLTEPPPDANARQALSHYWRGMAAFARHYPKAARFLDLHHHRGYLADESLKPERDGQAIAAAFIARGVEQGEVRKIAPMVLIALMTGAMRGLLAFADKGELTLDDATVRDIEDCLWNGIKA